MKIRTQTSKPPFPKLSPKYPEEERQEDADENGGGEGEIKGKVLFSNDNISGESSDPRNLLSNQQENPYDDDQDTHQDEHLA
jgi:hypothetical protein